MKIDVSELGDGESITCEFEENDDTIGLVDDGIVLLKPAKIEAVLNKIAENEIYSSIKIDVPVSLSCSLCLETFAYNITTQFNIEYIKRSGKPLLSEIDSNDDGEVEDSEEINFYDENIVDISEDVRQNIILNIPVRAVCKKDCFGLCLKCGKNLNFEKCSCADLRLENSPFSNLKNLLANKIKK
mgnify:CR=1 FL=1